MLLEYNFREKYSDKVTIIGNLNVESILIEENFENLTQFKKYLNSTIDDFALVRINNYTLTIISDVFNQVPIFYYRNETKILISTSLNNLISNPQYKKEINLNELHLYLVKGESYQSETLWKNIYQVPAGHILKFSNGKIHINEPYLQLPPEQYGKSKIEDTENQIKASILKYIKLGKNTGTLLSGGFDSSIISISNRLLQPNNTLYSFKKCSNYDSVKEEHFAQAVAKKYNLNHSEIWYETIDLEIESDIIKTTCLPEYTYVPFAYLWKIFEAAKEKNIEIILGGSLGDQVLGMDKVYLEYLFNGKRWKELGIALSKMNQVRQQDYRKKFLKGKLALLLTQKKYIESMKFFYAIIAKMKLSPVFIFKKLNKNYSQKEIRISKIKNVKINNYQSGIVKHFQNISKIKNRFYLELVYANDNLKANIQNQLIAQKFNIIYGKPFANRKLIDFFFNADLKANFNDGLGRGYALKSFSKYFPDELKNRKLKTEFSNLIKNYSLKLGEAIGPIPKNHKIWDYVDENEFKKLEKDVSFNPFTQNQRMYKRILSFKLWLDIFF